MFEIDFKLILKHLFFFNFHFISLDRSAQLPSLSVRVNYEVTH